MFRVIALCLLLWLTACGRQYVKPTNASPPSEAAVYCGPIMEPYIRTQDDLVRAYADLLDSWADCATRHRALVDWHER